MQVQLKLPTEGFHVGYQEAHHSPSPKANRRRQGRAAHDRWEAIQTAKGGHEAEQRFSRLEALWKDNEAFCRRLGRDVEWTDIAIWVSERIKRGELRIPIPPMGEILPSYSDCLWPGRLDLVINRYTDEHGGCHYPPDVDGLEREEAAHIFDLLSESFPSVNWLLPVPHAKEIMRSRENAARWSLEQLSKANNAMAQDWRTPRMRPQYDV